MSEEEDELEDDEMVLHVDGERANPFMIERLVCDNTFKAIIDTGSPVSIFRIEELQRIVGKRRVVVGEMIDNERYVDFKSRYLCWGTCLSASQQDQSFKDESTGSKERHKANSGP